jgi:ATP-dependent protease ClpP protease subunit
MKHLYRTNARARAISGVFGRPLEPFAWYEVNALSENESELMIYDIIGWPFNDAREVVGSISEMKGRDITVRINSPGGDIIDAVSIFNALNLHDSKVTTRIESMAASSASIIALAGHETQAYKSSFFMIHEPWLFTVGNSSEHAEAIEILDKITANMIDIYAEKANIGKREIKQLMHGEDKNDGSWMTAKEAKDKGFVDTILNSKGKAKAAFDLSMFENVPDDLVVEGNQTPTIRDAEKALRDAGFSRDKAKAMLAGGWQNADGDFEKDCEIVAQMLNETIQTFGGQLNG